LVRVKLCAAFVLTATEPNANVLGLIVIGLVGTPIFTLRFSVELPTEVTKVIVVSYVPAGWFAMKGYTYIVQDWPGPRLGMSWTMPMKGFVMQEPALTLKLPGLPVSVSLTSRGEPERFNRFTADAPEFVNVTNCAEKLPTLPVALRPKSSVEAETVGGTPGATTSAEMVVELFPVSALIFSLALYAPGGKAVASAITTVHDELAATIAGKTTGQVPPCRSRDVARGKFKFCSAIDNRVVGTTDPLVRVSVWVELLLVETSPNAIALGEMESALAEKPTRVFRFIFVFPEDVNSVNTES
jgi:hypothetical protein